MNIMVPVSSFTQVKRLSDVGADEFYIGIFDECWNDTFGVFEELNRMSSFGQTANVKYTEAFEIIDACQSLDKKVFLALNSNHYSKKQKKYLEKILANEKMKTVDGIIVGDLTLIPLLKKYNYGIILSTMGAAYNSLIIKQYIEWGVTRIIIPRDVQLVDIERIIQLFPELEFEVFLMRNGCKYSDAYCTAFHARKYGSMCSCIDAEKPQIKWIEDTVSDSYKREFISNNNLFTKAFHKKACGLCAIQHFQDIGVGSVKIVGRADDKGGIENDVRMVRAIIDKQDVDDSRYENCLYGMNCYYNLSSEIEGNDIVDGG